MSEIKKVLHISDDERYIVSVYDSNEYVFIQKQIKFSHDPFWRSVGAPISLDVSHIDKLFQTINDLCKLKNLR